jgi:uncharacterized protein involved in propanediol utilization
MKYSAKIYSRIGELMQGILPGASAFLVSGLSSRQWFSEAVLRHAEPGEAAKALPPKAMEALAAAERHAGLRLPAEMRLDLQSNIPWGKGLSSSSTDILSVLSVVNICLGAQLSTDALYRIAAAIEPTDPCLSDDIPIFYQHTGGSGGIVDLPPVTLVYFDTAPGTGIDTLAMHRQWPAGAGVFFSWLLKRLVTAAAARDYAAVFESITYSAEYNQLSLPLSGFADLYRLAEDVGAGLMIAHSGTIAGLLTRPEQAAEVMTRLEALVGARQVPGMAAQKVYMEHYSSPHHPSICPVSPVR